MAVTYDLEASGTGRPSDPHFFHRIEIAYAAETYLTGGIAMDWTDSGLDDAFTDKTVVAVIFEGGGAGDGYIAEYDHANEKIVIKTSNGAAPAKLAEYTNSTAVTATFSFLVVAI